MARWEYQDSAAIPNGGGELQLFSREMAKSPDFAIRIKGEAGDLMNSRQHGSEDALGELPITALIKQAGKSKPASTNQSTPAAASKEVRILIGGLGMGFTLAATLRALDDAGDSFRDPQVEVAELVPGVVEWNTEVIGACAGHPLNDPRARVIVTDVYRLIDRAEDDFDAIMLDVDNGPEGLTHAHNERLYSTEGLSRAMDALRIGGVLAVWSASPDRSFAARLTKIGFEVEERRVRAHAGKGARHVIWLATKQF